MDDEGNFVRLESGEDLLATIEGKDGVSVNIPEPILGWRDLFSIPGMFINFLMLIFDCSPCTTGSAVAVERIFSGGHDTISLRRASLIPDTIRVLMLVKHRLRLARINLTKKDQH